MAFLRFTWESQEVPIAEGLNTKKGLLCNILQQGG